MKTIIISVSSAFLLALGAANGAVTFTVANYTGTSFGPNGVPIVNAAGEAVVVGTVYASIGYFSSVPLTGAVVSASTVLTGFHPVDSLGVPQNFNGLFNGQDYSSSTNAYPVGFQGQQGYLVVGNNQNILASTEISVYTLGTFFPAPAADNTAAYAIGLTSTSSTGLRFGSPGAVTADGQPRIDTIPANNYVTGVQLLPSGEWIPEPSAALLGALGALSLLRRRRS
jgi:hypothetical protein